MGFVNYNSSSTWKLTVPMYNARAAQPATTSNTNNKEIYWKDRRSRGLKQGFAGARDQRCVACPCR
jgi:hypothetical protein